MSSYNQIWSGSCSIPNRTNSLIENLQYDSKACSLADDMKTIAGEVVRHNPISSLVVDNTQRPTEHSVPTPTFSKKMFSFL